MIKSKLGPSFCAAKWLQVTLDLYHGVSKSCHHTPWTTINIDQARQSPLYLTNTLNVLDDRVMMTKKMMPLACSYCWHHEHRAPKELSDRYHKSQSDWSQDPEYQERLDQLKPTKAQLPSYLEVLFDHRCQMRCVYCSADSSSAIEKELLTHGAYPETVHYHRSKRLVPSDHQSELLALFFQWLPDLLPALHTLRITGGEPLLSPSVATLMDYLRQTSLSLKRLNFALNSNLMIRQSKWDNFLNDLEIIHPKIKAFQLFTSVDTAGDDAEYIRKGLNYPLFLERLSEFGKRYPESEVIIMVTFNKYSVNSFSSFLEDMTKMKKSIKNLVLDISPLQEPSFLSIKNMTSNQVTLIKKSLEYMQANKDLYKVVEITKMKRLYQLAQSYQNLDKAIMIEHEKDFKTEFDRR